ncbi:putative ABC transport system permease protein [Rhodanobacter sp. ANJX3]|uniref:ABC transporter permease n=1 Tax=unclassified Rhodanobacter TaxID=2621553 RepID=UPI0015CA5120|nr:MULTISPECIES: ABC transporter permease [unclassified Rhodanobacter]MBB5359992.1 putative ABC transport system permease protein [Rhodanobacter sp. ANJX3]NYE28912.1 putative ABC transport system permease protein [Rhodanobacter sp. K2T2]
MFAYYVGIAVRNLRRSWGLTLLMVLAIGLGVAASVTTFAVFRAVSGDPVPDKSSQLFVPLFDMWGPRNGVARKDPPDALDYFDAMNLMRDHRASRQSAIYPIQPALAPADSNHHSKNIDGNAVYSEFFPMAEVPLRFGNGWSDNDDRQHATVAVISSALNDELFAGKNSVGRTINIAGKDFRVVGVLDNWNPQPRFYDVHNSGGFTTQKVDILVPFQTAITAGIKNTGNTNCNSAMNSAGFDGLIQSNCVWISYMVELRDASAVQAFRGYLDDYVNLQNRAGRFHWKSDTRLMGLREWLEFEEVAPSDTHLSLLVAIGLLAVCIINTTGLLLAKFMRRRGEVGIRRALGATKRSVYLQFVTEASLVGLSGGVFGLALTALGVAGVHALLPKDIASLAHLDAGLLGLCLLTAVVATTLAGLFPAARASAVQPALQLKMD